MADLVSEVTVNQEVKLCDIPMWGGYSTSVEVADNLILNTYALLKRWCALKNILFFMWKDLANIKNSHLDKRKCTNKRKTFGWSKHNWYIPLYRLPKTLVLTGFACSSYPMTNSYLWCSKFFSVQAWAKSFSLYLKVAKAP